MTYFGFLARFLGIPIVIMLGLLWWEWRNGRGLPPAFKTWSAKAVIIGHIVVAVVYTTPWDNYLVATAVWWYDPNLVTGYTIGWVPIEEYTFFVLQTWLSGMWVVWLMRRITLPARPFQPSKMGRIAATASLGLVWLISTIYLLSGYEPTTYLTLILSWSLIPIMIQTAFGADVLWHYRRLVLWGIIPTSLYLGAADAIAIAAGTWTISPDQTVGIYLGPILPLEEFLFFCVTNILVVFGALLVMARQSHERVATWPRAWQRWLPAVDVGRSNS